MLFCTYKKQGFRTKKRILGFSLISVGFPLERNPGFPPKNFLNRNPRLGRTKKGCPGPPLKNPWISLTNQGQTWGPQRQILAITLLFAANPRLTPRILRLLRGGVGLKGNAKNFATTCNHSPSLHLIFHMPLSRFLYESFQIPLSSNL